MSQHNSMQGLILCTFISGMIYSTTLSAQVNYSEVVYLKNGSIVHGTIIELVPNETIKIKTVNNDVILFKMDEIQKITREESTSMNTQRDRVTDENVKTHGFTNMIEFVYGNAEASDLVSAYYAFDKPSLGIVTVNGYMFNPHLSVGLGIGIHGYNNIGFIPVYADVRYNAIKGTITPFVSFDAGYSFTTDEIAHNDRDQIRGGIYSNLSIGIKFFTRKSQALAFSFGYNYQNIQVYTDAEFPEDEMWVEDQIENMALKFSFVF
jgi:hypothetical protein